MNLGRQLVTRVVATGELQPLLDAGFTKAWLEDPDCGSTAVFTKEHRQAYTLILDEYAQHGRVLTQSRLLRNLPSYQLDDDESSLSELVSDATRAAQRAMLLDAMGGIDQLNIEGKVDDAVKQLGLWSQHISTTVSTSGLRHQTLDASELANLADPQSLIEGFIDTGYLMQLYGRWATGKSFLALDWAAHLATGMDWHGHKTTQVKVLYVASEGGWGQKKRVAAWQKYHDIMIPQGQLSFKIEPIQLHQPEHVAWLIQQNREHEYGLIIFDTQARCTLGLNENDAQEMGPVIQNLTTLRDAWGPGKTACMLIHHAGKGGDDRGSSAVPAAIDSQFKIEGEVPGPLTLKCTKRKDGEPPFPHPISMEKVELPDKQDSLVIQPLMEADDDWSDAVKLLRWGATTQELQEKLGVSRASAFRYQKKYEETYHPAPERDDEDTIIEEAIKDAVSKIGGTRKVKRRFS